MSSKENNSVSNFPHKIKNNKYLWPILVIALIIISLSKFTNAIRDIEDFFTPSLEVKKENSMGIPEQSDKTTLTRNQNSSKIFQNSNPYPTNYQKVKLGGKLSMLRNAYSGNRGLLNESGRYFSVGR